MKKWTRKTHNGKPRDLTPKEKKPVGRPKSKKEKPEPKKSKNGKKLGRPKKVIEVKTEKVNLEVVNPPTFQVDLVNSKILDFNLDYIMDFNCMLGTEDEKLRKELLLKEIAANWGNVSKACQNIHFPRNAFYNMIDSNKDLYDPFFSAYFNQIEEILKDFVEMKLMYLINDNDRQAIFFYLKTKCKDRGYVEKTELNNLTQLPININIVKPENYDE